MRLAAARLVVALMVGLAAARLVVGLVGLVVMLVVLLVVGLAARPAPASCLQSRQVRGLPGARAHAPPLLLPPLPPPPK